MSGGEDLINGEDLASLLTAASSPRVALQKRDVG